MLLFRKIVDLCHKDPIDAPVNLCDQFMFASVLPIYKSKGKSPYNFAEFLQMWLYKRINLCNVSS